MLIDYVIQSGDNGGVINVDCRLEPYAIQLPAPSAAFKVTIKDVHGYAVTNNITIVRSATTVLIDGEANDDIIATPYGAITYLSNGTNWFRISSNQGTAAEAIFFGGDNGGARNIIDYTQLSGQGTSDEFGNLTLARYYTTGLGNATRAVSPGGYDSTNDRAEIVFVEFASKSQANAFGNLAAAKRGTGALANSTRGVIAGGTNGPDLSAIEYITIANLANAQSFGNLTDARSYIAGLSSPTRGVFTSGGSENIIDYVTIASTGNATDFGDVATGTRRWISTAASPTRGLFMGGDTSGSGGNIAINLIDYITIASPSNVTNFGTLVATRASGTGVSNKTYGFVAGGYSVSSVIYGNIERVLIASLGNSANWGNLTVGRTDLGGASNAHGGL